MASCRIPFLLFLELYYNYSISPMLFSPLNPSMYPSQLCFKFMAHFFCCCYRILLIRCFLSLDSSKLFVFTVEFRCPPKESCCFHLQVSTIATCPCLTYDPIIVPGKLQSQTDQHWNFLRTDECTLTRVVLKQTLKATFVKKYVYSSLELME